MYINVTQAILHGRNCLWEKLFCPMSDAHSLIAPVHPSDTVPGTLVAEQCVLAHQINCLRIAQGTSDTSTWPQNAPNCASCPETLQSRECH